MRLSTFLFQLQSAKTKQRFPFPLEPNARKQADGEVGHSPTKERTCHPDSSRGGRVGL